MKRLNGFVLATCLALAIASCATEEGGTPGSNAAAAVPEAARNFNLAVKCPGVHYLKTHGRTDEQIMQQESLEEGDIAACEQWVQAQPKGYVPPPPEGTAPAAQQANPAATPSTAAPPASK